MVDQYDMVGVDYEILDGSKRAALTTAAATSALIEQHDGNVLEDSRGAFPISGSSTPAPR